MPWIETVAYEDANAKLNALYDRVKVPDNNIVNVVMMHCLRPHSMEGHMAIYKYVLHHHNKTINKCFLESLGVRVSSLNECDYCVEHHFAGPKRLLNDEEKSVQIRAAINTNNIEAAPLNDRQKIAIEYARQLTRDPGGLREEIIKKLRKQDMQMVRF